MINDFILISRDYSKLSKSILIFNSINIYSGYNIINDKNNFNEVLILNIK